jgi:predicted MFS family arabinose efflux permease
MATPALQPEDARSQPGIGKDTLFLLAACNFVVGSGAMALTGLIAPMADELAVSAASAAQLLAAYAVSFAISAPIVAVLAARICRKVLLVWALACFGVLMMAGAVAPGYGLLWVARAAAGIAAAAFVPNAAAVAASLARPSERGRALTVVFGGFTAALVLGAPLGTYVGLAYGWRFTLGALGLAALALAAAAKLRLPGGIMVPGATLAVFRAALSQGRLLALLAINALSAFGSFVVFSLASVAFPVLLGTAPANVANALLVFGLGALAGNALSVALLDRVGAAPMATAALLANTVALAVLASLGATPLAWGALAVWGLANFAGTTALQTRLVAAGPALSSALLPMNSSAQFAGQSLGAAVGGLWLAVQSDAVAGLAWIGCFALLVSTLASWLHGVPQAPAGGARTNPAA